MRYVILILIMVTVWGLLTKSLTDSETIEEMVDRKIAEHEENPEAHMGDGESIDVHRKNSIIDHPAGSVLADKNSMKEIFHRVIYNLDAVSQNVGSNDIQSGSFLEMYNETSQNAYSVISRAFPYTLAFKHGKDWMYQGAFVTNPNGDPTFKFRIGITSSASGNEPNLYLQMNGAEAFIKSNLYLNTFTSDTFNVPSGATHTFRIHYIGGENIFRFYLDGSLVYEHEKVGTGDFSFYYIQSCVMVEDDLEEMEVPISDEFISIEV